MHLFRVVVEWSGGAVVGRAVNVLHFDGSNQTAPALAAIKNSFTALAPTVASNVTMTIPSTGDIIEDTNGTLQGVWNGAGGGAVPGQAPAASAAGVGACVTWSTGGIVQGAKGPRKLRGRTFAVPLAVGGYDADGTFRDSTLAAIQAWANGLQAAGGLAVWHRPLTPGASNGNSYAVLGNKVRDRVAFLSSRRQ